MTDGERALSRRGSILLGIAVVGLFIVAVSIWAGGEKFEAPRWIVASVGSAFLFFGSWIALCYGLGYDPKRPEETLPSPLLQLVFAMPGLFFFALPFHWIAFGPGERRFSGGLSFPLLFLRHGNDEMSGRIAFGIGAVLIDLLIVYSAVRLIGRRRDRAASPQRDAG
ncbi:MAG TPA: hypothetical protein VGL03_02840 [Thermoanaerobaculia bacterium]|jgi:hypothetical protein